jgi:hypothetical protein
VALAPGRKAQQSAETVEAHGGVPS